MGTKLLKDRLVADVRERTWESFSRRGGDTFVTIRELARRYRIKQEAVLKIIADDALVCIITGMGADGKRWSFPLGACDAVGDWTVEWIGSHLLEVGTVVKIEQRKTTLIAKIEDITGGWEVDPPVLGDRYWNEDVMKVVK